MSLSDGWKLEPAFDGDTVVGFLAWQDPGNVPAGSYAVIWHERNTDGSYSMKGFDDPDPLDAAKYLTIDRNNEFLFARSGLDQSVTASSSQPKEMQSGLAVDDPLQPIASMLDPELMEIVVSAGAKGATELSAKSVEGASNGFTTLDSELHLAAIATEIAIVGDRSSLTLAQGAEPIASTLTDCVTINNVPGGAGGTTTGGGFCRFTFPTSTVCVTNTNGVITTTTTPGTRTCDCPMPASGTCPSRPSCPGCP